MTPELVSLLPVHGAGSGLWAFDRWSCAPSASRWTLRVRCIHGRGHGRTRRLVSANLEHDLAALPAARDSLERRPRLRERKDRVDLSAKLACVHERSQLQQLHVVGFDDEVDRAWHLLCDRDHALARGDLAATSVEDQIDWPALDDGCA